MPELTRAGERPLILTFVLLGGLSLLLWYGWLKPYLIRSGRVVE
jgi:hypothetical protein